MEQNSVLIRNFDKSVLIWFNDYLLNVNSNLYIKLWGYKYVRSLLVLRGLLNISNINSASCYSLWIFHGYKSSWNLWKTLYVYLLPGSLVATTVECGYSTCKISSCWLEKKEFEVELIQKFVYLILPYIFVWLPAFKDRILVWLPAFKDRVFTWYVPTKWLASGS